MPEYKNKPEGFIFLRKKIIWKSIPISALSIVTGLVISYFGEKNNPVDLLTWSLIVAVAIFAVFFGIKKGIEYQKSAYNKYALEVGIDYITYKKDGLTAETFCFNEITKIEEDKDGNLLVYGQVIKKKPIFVSVYLENYDELKNTLLSIEPITPQLPKNVLKKYPLMLPLFVAGLMACVYISYNKIIVAVSGLLLLSFLIWAFFSIRKSMPSDSPARRSLWWLPVVLFSIICIVFYKVFG
jgi:hypothetical protein